MGKNWYSKPSSVARIGLTKNTTYKWANSGIDESSPAEVKADVEGHNMAKTAGKEEMGKG